MGYKELILIAFLPISIALIFYSFRNIKANNDLGKPSKLKLMAISLIAPLLGFFLTRKAKNKAD